MRLSGYNTISCLKPAVAMVAGIFIPGESVNGLKILASGIMIICVILLYLPHSARLQTETRREAVA